MTTEVLVEKYYRHTPKEQVEELMEFRLEHPITKIAAADAEWEYLASGSGPETLLILPGLIGIAEMTFQHISAFEMEYRVIVPSYPFSLKTISQLIDGVAAVLDAEKVSRTNLLGGSYGGMVAQAFVRKYPERVSKLILSHTGGPKPERAEKNKNAVGMLKALPMPVLRWMLRKSTQKELVAAPEQRVFWVAYSDEMVARLRKEDLISRLEVAVDFDRSSNFTPDELAGWDGRILILEGDNDPIADALAREQLKSLHPQAQVYTFHGSGHVASIARLDEYVGVIKKFLGNP